MYLTRKEIFGQYEALRKTYDYMLEREQQIKTVFEKHKPKSLTFIGCGSGYTLCHSGEVSTKLRLNLPANAVAAGDLLVNFEQYRGLLTDTMIIAASRSGGTSEVVLSVERAKEMGVPTVAIPAKENSPLAALAELSLEIPWVFDESVCQTRTVTNFYAAQLLLIAILAEDRQLLA
ncbi:MAG TPA: SIS domain-containing protein, partial [Firmicutes bacterium]|nr:SIS domain-containing protein [Bacillota bacterium]